MVSGWWFVYGGLLRLVWIAGLGGLLIWVWFCWFTYFVGGVLVGGWCVA